MNRRLRGEFKLKAMVGIILAAAAFAAAAPSPETGENALSIKIEAPKSAVTEKTEELQVRIAEIEVFPEKLGAYLSAAATVGAESVAKEPGVVCIFPMQKKDSPTSIRIVEIYRGEEAYRAHLETSHFRAYKEGTAQMIKSLKLVPMKPLDAENMSLIFVKEQNMEKEKAAPTQISKESAELTEKERVITDLGSAVARGDQEKLSATLKRGFESGLTLSEAKELIGQLYAYCGFPRALNAASTLKETVEELESNGVKIEEGRAPSPFKSDYDALKDGEANQTKLCGGPVKGALFDFHPQLDLYLKAHLFGDIFERDAIDWRTREIVTIAALAACPETEPQMKAHVAIGKSNGVTDAQADEIVRLSRETRASDNRTQSPTPTTLH